MRIETHAQQITTFAEMRAAYEAAHARLWGAPPVNPKPELMPAPPVEIAEPPPAPALPLPLPSVFRDLFAHLNLKVLTVHRVVAAHYGITIRDMKGTGRTAKCCKPRQVAAYICARHFGVSLPAIGRFTNRDHTTVLHGRNIVEGRMARSPAYAEEVAALVALCRSPAE